MGVGNSESCTVAEAGHVECGWMRGRRPGKQLCVLWNKPNHLPGSQHGSVCPGRLPLGSAVPTNSMRPWASHFSALERPFLNVKVHTTQPAHHSELPL